MDKKGHFVHLFLGIFHLFFTILSQYVLFDEKTCAIRVMQL